MTNSNNNPANLLAKDAFMVYYGVNQRHTLVKAHGLDAFKDAFYSLTLGELAERFNLPQPR
jgi:hypothetical protein